MGGVVCLFYYSVINFSKRDARADDRLGYVQSVMEREGHAATSEDKVLAATTKAMAAIAV